jgi:regulation of enolase protein 1 (concanavalin A-like superfamily)
MRALLILSLCLAAVARVNGAETPAAPANQRSIDQSRLLFKDDFRGKLDPGWHWLREHKKFWRVTSPGLEVRIEPGNMWGPQNNARNVLLRPAPEVGRDGIEIAVTVQNTPTNQYEQTDLVWYLDDSNMVKLGQEMVDGRLSVVMGREENDKTRTISITPLDSTTVRLRLTVQMNAISGAFSTDRGKSWKGVGTCEWPRSEKAGSSPKISLQFYQGARGEENWSRVSEFQIVRREYPSPPRR